MADRERKRTSVDLCEICGRASLAAQERRIRLCFGWCDECEDKDPKLQDKEVRNDH